MNKKQIANMVKECSFVRTGASDKEHALLSRFEEYLSSLSVKCRRQSFAMPGYSTRKATFCVDGEEIKCRAIWGFGQGEVNAPLYYLRRVDPVERARCKGKIVLLDGALRASVYDFLFDAGALGIIASCGDAFYPDAAVDQRARAFTLQDRGLIPCAMIHVKDCVRLVEKKAKRASLSVEFETFPALSHNLIVDIPGKSKERIDICAHYDSTYLSRGSYDNLSGALALLYLAEYFSHHPCHRSIRLVFFGSEEKGLCGSLYYCASEEISGAVLNINLDMIGSTMGAVEAISCADERMEEYLKAFLKKHRIAASVRHGIRSSDSTSYVKFGVPAVSFARYAPEHIVRIHTLYDLPETVSTDRLAEDMAMVAAFTEKVASSDFSIAFAISEHVQRETEAQMARRLMPPFAE